MGLTTGLQLKNFGQHSLFGAKLLSQVMLTEYQSNP